MTDDTERLVNELIEDTACYSCGTEFQLDTSDLDEGNDFMYVGDYSCPDCDSKYQIEIEDNGHMYGLEAYRTDEDSPMPEDVLQISESTRKTALQERTHPARELVEGLVELDNSLELLTVNKRRINDAGDEIRTENGFDQDAEFDASVNTDIHNYMASAYSFDEVLDTVEPNLPTDGPVASAKDDYEEANEVISGLRTYAQHHLALPWRMSDFDDENTGQRETTFVVPLESVNTIDSDIDRFGPDGYMRGADHHYSDVEGDDINIERRIKLHYDSSVELVKTIYEHADDVHEDELDDYQRVTTHGYYSSNNQ